MSRPYTEIPAFVLGLFEDCRDVLYETAARVKDRLSEEGKPSTSPVQWDTERQRVAYFASNGFGAGIPYKRTHSMRLGLQLERVPLGSNLRIPHPGGAVYGLPSGWQSRIHRNRWPHLLTVLFEELEKIPVEVSRRISVRGD